MNKTKRVRLDKVVDEVDQLRDEVFHLKCQLEELRHQEKGSCSLWSRLWGRMTGMSP